MVDPVERDTTRGGGVAYLLDALRTRPAGRRTLSAIAVVLFAAGIGLFAYPLATDIYVETVVQPELEEAFTVDEPTFREQYITRTVPTGDPLTRIIMSDIGVDSLVVEGTSPAALRAGAGHYPATPLPGEEGNVAIAGHRTTYGHPFNRIDELDIGAEIQLETPLGLHTYRVIPAPENAARPCGNGACWITDPYDWGVVAPMDGSMLTLTTCHPKGSARERLILRAELVHSEQSATGATESS